MPLSFEHRRDAVHEGILSGSIGCPFAKIAAENDEIEYCRSPQTINVQKINTPYIDAITHFARQETKTVLIGLPETDDIVTEDECRLYAKMLFPETVSSMRFATQNMLDTLLAEALNGDEDLYELLESNPMHERGIIFDFWRHNGSQLRNKMPEGPLVAPSLLRRKSRKLEQMFTFSMDSTYRPLTSIPHPRHSPHVALIINYRNDLKNLETEEPELYQETQRWMKSAVGYVYAEGYRIGQRPAERVDKPKNDTKN